MRFDKVIEDTYIGEAVHPDEFRALDFVEWVSGSLDLSPMMNPEKCGNSFINVFELMTYK